LTAPKNSALPATDTLPGLGHRFADAGLLRQSLSHRSAGYPHNERLEFLGDSLVGLVVAELLYEQFPKASEGELTRLRARLVRRESLAAQARALDLGKQLHLGQGELKSGGFRRESILADAFEALVGALYLDGGWNVCRDWLRSRFADAMCTLDPTQLADPKTRLQEWLQARGRPLPDYRLVSSHGDAHAQTFRVECHIDGGMAPTAAAAASRKQAEQLAAEAMLAQLEIPDGE
jgi:ribonuclease-3